MVKKKSMHTGLTMPKSPRFQVRIVLRVYHRQRATHRFSLPPRAPPLRQSLKRTRSTPKLSTTSLELQKIMAERAQLKQQQKAYHAMYEKIHSTAGNPVKALPARSTKPLTLPQEPMFATDDRVKPPPVPPSPYKSLAQQVQEYQSKTPARFRKSSSQKTKPSPAAARPRVTTPVPFKFATEDAAKRRPAPLSSTELEMAELAALPKFKARPVNANVLHGAGDAGLPKTHSKQLTLPQPFHLRSDERHRKAVEDFEARSKREQAEATQARKFKAQGIMSARAAPVPAPAPRPPTKVVAKPLPSDIRAMSRAEFEADKARREEEAKRAAEEAKRRKEQHERQEVKQLRKTMSFKAQPFKQQVAPPALKSNKPLTCPLTPHFATDKRVRHASGEDAL